MGSVPTVQHQGQLAQIVGKAPERPLSAHLLQPAGAATAQAAAGLHLAEDRLHGLLAQTVPAGARRRRECGGHARLAGAGVHAVVVTRRVPAAARARRWQVDRDAAGFQRADVRLAPVALSALASAGSWPMLARTWSKSGRSWCVSTLSTLTSQATMIWW